MRARRRGRIALAALAVIFAIGGAIFLLTRSTPNAIEREAANGAGDVMPVLSPPALATAPREHDAASSRESHARGAVAPTAGAPSTPASGAEPRRLVVDADGKPVVGVGLDVFRASALGAAGRFKHRFFRLDGSDATRRACREEWTTAANGTIDGDAMKFAFDASPYAFATLRSADPAWVVTSGGVDEPIRLARATWLSVTVLADADGSRIRECEGWVSARGYGEGFSATNGGFVVQWPPAKDGEPLDITLVIKARGFASETREIRIPVDVPSLSTEFRLKPAAAPGTLVVRTIDAPDSLLARPFDLEIRSPAQPDMNVDRRPVERRADGAFAVDVPAGSWHVRLRPRDGWANPTGWEQDVQIVSDAESEFTWVVPPTGTVRIEVADDVPPGSWMSIGPRIGGSAANLAHRGTFEVTHVPLGVWVVNLRSGGPDHAYTSVDVEVKANETAVARLSTSADSAGTK